MSLNVMDPPFNAVGDYTTGADDTAAFQAAHDASPIGGVVHVPPAITRYRIANVRNTRAVRFLGEGWQPYAFHYGGPDNSSLPGKGSWIHVDTPGASAFIIEPDPSGNNFTGAGIEHLAFAHAHAPIVPGWVPTNYDYAAKVVGAKDVGLRHLMFLNAPKAIGLLNGVARIDIQNIKGQPLQQGLYVDGCYGELTVNLMDFWPHWVLAGAIPGDPVQVYMNANASAFLSFRNDNPRINGLFTYGYRFGLRLMASALGKTSHLQASHLGFDATMFGLTVEGNDTTADINSIYSTYGTRAMWVTANNCKVAMRGFVGEYQQNELVRVDGTGNSISVGDPRGLNWALAGGGVAAMRAAAGNKLYINGHPDLVTNNGAPLYGGAAGTIIGRQPLTLF